MTQPFTVPVRVIVPVLFVIALVVLGTVYWWPANDSGLKPTAHFPEVNYPKSEYQNASLEVSYVGSERCQECHAHQYSSWSQSAHAKAMGEVQLAHAPPDGEVRHQKSGRIFEVYRKAGQMYHRESIIRPNGTTVLLDLPVKYVMGSGHHSTSYLVERDGFLVESPVTWYREKNAWGMSPGYDHPTHSSFQRTIPAECVLCHAGQIESNASSPFKFQIHEMSVSCEHCHGPGEFHVDHPDEPILPNIVHPGKLTRELQEDVCSDCHLGATVRIRARGRDYNEFRPALPLSAFRHEYSLVTSDHDNQNMTVTGHVEQMRSSACWQKSEEFTCTTCHDMHPEDGKLKDFRDYRSICLDCHSCQEDEAVRLKRVSNDSCVVCHMPTTPTDLPHFTFTHHRVGIYDSALVAPSEDLPAEGTLVPVHEVERLDRSERQLSLGLAALELAERHKSSPSAVHYRKRGRETILQLAADGYLNEDMAVVLARSFYEVGNYPASEELAKKFLSQNLASPTKLNLLETQAQAAMQAQRFADAIPVFRQLTQARYEPSDWVALGVCLEKQQQLHEAIRAVDKALEIDPANGLAHQFLATLLEQAGRSEEAAKHQKMSSELPSHSFDAFSAQ